MDADTRSKPLPLTPSDTDVSSVELRMMETTATPIVLDPFSNGAPQSAQRVHFTHLPEANVGANHLDACLGARDEPSGRLRCAAPPIAPHPYGSRSMEQARNVTVFQVTSKVQVEPQETNESSHVAGKMLEPRAEPSSKPWRIAPTIHTPQRYTKPAIASRHVDIFDAGKATSSPPRLSPLTFEHISLSDRADIQGKEAGFEAKQFPTPVMRETLDPPSRYAATVDTLPKPVIIRSNGKGVNCGRSGKRHSLRDTSTQIAFAVGCVAVTGWTGILIEFLGLIVGKGISGPIVGFIVLALVIAYFLLVWRLLLVGDRWMKPLTPVVWTVGLIVGLSLVGMVILGIIVGVRGSS